MLAGPRLRQVALVAGDCEATAGQLQEAFGWPEPFHDPGVAYFGLINAVFSAGDTFIEVVTPAQPGTTAGRYLTSRGGDSGYMAIFQMPDLALARARVAAAGVRVIWSADHADIAGTHLHPKDVPGAIVSLDWADPPQSWRWAGPRWTGQAPAHPDREVAGDAGGAGGAPPASQRSGVSGITIEVTEPADAAGRWARVLGLDVTDAGGTPTIELPDARQDLRFVPATPDRGEGIIEVRLATDDERPPVQIAGVRFVPTGGKSA